MSTQNPAECQHVREQPENAEWTEEAYWAHFCNCLDDTKRRETLAKMREWTAKGTHCFLADHPHTIEKLNQGLAHATHVIREHHDFLDLRMEETKGLLGDRGIRTAYKRAHDNLVNTYLGEDS